MKFGTSRGSTACGACGSDLQAPRCAHCGTATVAAPGSAQASPRRPWKWAIAGVLTLLALGVALDQLQARFGWGADPGITCPSGTTLHEEAPERRDRVRWCARTNAKGEQERHGPFMSWDVDGTLAERSTYADGELHGLQTRYHHGLKVSEGEWRKGKQEGPWREYLYLNSGNFRLKTEGSYKDGVQEGRWRFFDGLGRLEEEVMLEKGLKHGVWSRYHDGDKLSECTYERDYRNGPCTSWHPGKGVRERGLYKNEKKVGLWVSYHLNGQKWSEGTYGQDGEEEGEWSSWHPNGQLASWGTYVNGQETGRAVTWFANGQKDSEGSFEQGEMRGPWTYWLGNGKKRKEFVFQPDGLTLTREWYPHGQLKSRGFTTGERDKKKVATWTTWHENGKKESLIVYSEDLKNGLAITWHPNGRKASEGRYVRNSQTGAWSWWTPEGKVERVQKFPEVSPAR